ncbi:hypothetical protein [Gaetbulibacter aestuarii]|uniref:Lipocalin-like domain-containing protein n=1 Tax=Gaetbulibacter aestuarii TaxID=1502358 RepID=A0ABW7MWA4_9FLAO
MVTVTRLLCFFLTSSLVSGQNISGSWNWTYKAKHQSTITLKETRPNNYKGNYCSVFFNGMKIDCGIDQGSNGIFLTKTNENIFTGTFECSFSNTYGTLKLEYLPDSKRIKIEVLKKPKGEFYLPSDVVFKK